MQDLIKGVIAEKEEVNANRKRGGVDRKMIQWPSLFIFKRGLLNFKRSMLV
jgi:hypothetical protein